MGRPGVIYTPPPWPERKGSGRWSGNRSEAKYAVARAVFHGRKGELRQKYREGMENQLGPWGWWSMPSSCGTPGILRWPLRT